MQLHHYMCVEIYLKYKTYKYILDYHNCLSAHLAIYNRCNYEITNKDAPISPT